jgi:glucokinase
MNSQVLLADIGGTYSRFASLGPNGRPDRTVTFANDSFASLEEAIESYLAELDAQPETAILAVAGPVGGREIALTNRGWRFHLDKLARRFALARVHALNDFEALAWALGHLESGDVRKLGQGAGARSLHGAKVVLGPGTGLGVAALVLAGDGWQAVASEGGHVTFGAASKTEETVFARLREDGPVSAEMALSGPGLQRLHSALHPGAAPLAAETVVAHALEGDPAAGATIRLFVTLLGRFAGDVALTFKAVGGVYVTGGVTTGLGALLDEEVFRVAFEAHPPYADLLKGIPTFLITCAQPGLLGCAALAIAMQRS